MKKNIGKTDKIIRIILAVIVGVLYFTGTITGTAGMIAGIVAIVLLATAFINWCLIYSIFGIKTSQK